MTVQQTFWSRRKQAVEAEARQEAAARIAAKDAEVLAVQERKTDDALLEELGLPDPDMLKMGDDFSVFMAKAVPTRLRNRALRKLWLSNPVLANLDDLVDYADDFTDAGLSGEAVRTSYQVGKGLLKHAEELARQQDLEEHPDGADAAAIAGAEHAVEEETEDLTVSAPDALAAQDTEEAEVAVAAPKRRMRFVQAANT